MPALQPGFRWSWKVGELLGIAIRVHVTLVILLAWIVGSYAAHGAGVVETLYGVLLVATVFAIIVLHELGHAVVARRFGCTTRDIVLLPIGGMARIDRMPERPSQELLVALAGPAVNVALAIVLGVVVVVTGAAFDPTPISVGGLATQLVWINLALAVFNLLPALPMDGGRVLRAALAMRIGRERATRVAAKVAKGFAVVFALVGLLWNPMLALIGVFVWFAAQQEVASSELRSVLSGVTVDRAMLRKLEIVEADESIDALADRMLAGGVRQLVVLDHGQLAGIITAADVAHKLAAVGPQGTVAAVMQRDVAVVAPSDTLESVLPRLEQAGVVVVMDRGTLVGVLSIEQLAAFAALRTRPEVVHHRELHAR